jgi:RNA recognition motif-containing protein
MSNRPLPCSLQGFAYVEFETAEGVATAVAKDGAVLKGRALNIARSRPPGSSEDHTAFVKGLGNEVGDEDLRRLLGEAPGGGIISVRMPRDEGGRSKVGEAGGVEAREPFGAGCGEGGSDACLITGLAQGLQVPWYGAPRSATSCPAST